MYSNDSIVLNVAVYWRVLLLNSQVNDKLSHKDGDREEMQKWKVNFYTLNYCEKTLFIWKPLVNSMMVSAYSSDHSHIPVGSTLSYTVTVLVKIQN